MYCAGGQFRKSVSCVQVSELHTLPYAGDRCVILAWAGRSGTSEEQHRQARSVNNSDSYELHF